MQRSSFFNAVISKEGVPDRSYLAEDFARYFATFIGNGVFPNPSSQLQVVAIDNNMNIRVKKGFAWVNGYMYENTDDYILTLDNSDGLLDRIDRVVLRLDFLERVIKVVVKKGDWNSNAVPKDLQRDSDAYEIALADIKVSKGAISISQQDITDLRFNKELCGIVHGTVEQVDTTAIFNQFQDWYSTTKNNYDKDIATWTKEKKETFEKWYTENTSNFTRKFEAWFKNTEIWEKDFTTWLDKIKEVLNGDVAGNLLNKIDQNTKMINNLKNDINAKEKSVQESIDNLKSHVDNGKSSLYSAIIGKKATPRSKDFKDLTDAITNIKLGQGNAQASEVLAGKTFTNDTGIMRIGTMPNMGSRELTPKTYVQELGRGYYDNIKVKDVSVDYAINKLFTSDNNKKDIINQITISKTLEIIKNIYDNYDDSKKEEIQEGLSKNFACGKAELKKMTFEFNEEQLKKMNEYHSENSSQGFTINFDTSMYKNGLYVSAKGDAGGEFNLKFHSIYNENLKEIFDIDTREYDRYDQRSIRKFLRSGFWECSLKKDKLTIYSGNKNYCNIKNVKCDLEIFGF
ncbi:hypothetical protein [Clostridium novyi]